MSTRDDVQKLSPDMQARIVAAEEHMRGFLAALGADMHDDNLVNTPLRVAKMFACELLSGEDDTKAPEIVSFPTPNIADKFVVEHNLPVRSLCAHHLMPINGYAHIGCYYSLNNTGSIYDEPEVLKLPGLSKYARVVEYFSRRFQLQERLGEQIANYLLEKTGAKLVIVRIVARHYCMIQRGVMTEKTETSTDTIRYKNNDSFFHWPVAGALNSKEELIARFNAGVK